MVSFSCIPAKGQLRNTKGEAQWWLGLEPGEAAIVSLIYTSCPHACPAATATLARVDAESWDGVAGTSVRLLAPKVALDQSA